MTAVDERKPAVLCCHCKRAPAAGFSPTLSGHFCRKCHRDAWAAFWAPVELDARPRLEELETK